MIFAKIHTFNGGQQTICARADQPDTSWLAFDVPNADWLAIRAGKIEALQAGEVYSARLVSQINSAIAKTYADVDAVYSAAVGNRAPEYEQAEQAALVFQAAGYTGAASPYVSDYAVAAGISNQASADLIIARAAGLRTAAQLMRSTRFTSQKAMREATTQAELDAAVVAWETFIAQVRASLGL